MAKIEPDEFKEHFETDMGDPALQRLLDDAYGSIEQRFGIEGEQTVTIMTYGHDRYLMLPRPITEAAAVDSITQRLGETETELETDEWRHVSGRTIERLIGAGVSNPALWGWNFAEDAEIPFQTIVVYTPKEDVRRNRVAIDLVKLAIQNQGLNSERAGDYSSATKEYQQERRQILSELSRLMFV